MAESMMVLAKVEMASGMRNRPVTFSGGREELNIVLLLFFILLLYNYMELLLPF